MLLTWCCVLCVLISCASDCCFDFPVPVDQQNCHDELNYYEPYDDWERRERNLVGCGSDIHLGVVAGLHDIESEEYDVYIKASLHAPESEKGCGRDSNELYRTYKQCDVSHVTELLPSDHLDSNNSFTTSLPRHVTAKGGVDFVFDGSTSVRYPNKLITPLWYTKYSVSGWLYIEKSYNRQYVLSWSAGDKLDRDLMGFYVSRKPGSHHVTFGFQLRHQDKHRADVICHVHTKWREHHVTSRWHFIALTFQDCKAELSVDGKSLSEIPGANHYSTPEPHVQPKLLIGARYVGFNTKPDDYFHGKISGLVLVPRTHLTMPQVNCLLNCREKLMLANSIPDSLQLELETAGSEMEMQGRATKKEVQQAINSLVYATMDTIPWSYKRLIDIFVENRGTKKSVRQRSSVQVTRPRTQILIGGNCGAPAHGERLCREIHVVVEGCSGDIEQVVVEVQPRLNASESIFIPLAQVRRYGLRVDGLENGFRILGSASPDVYSKLLQRIKYVHKDHVAGDFNRTVKITASMYSGLARSNAFEIKLDSNSTSTQNSSNKFASSKPSSSSDQPTRKLLVPWPATPSLPIHQMTPELAPVVRPHNMLPYSDLIGLGGGQGKGRHAVSSGSSAIAIMGVIFGTFVFVTLAGYGLATYRTKYSDRYTASGEKETQTTPSDSNDYFWDEEGLPVRVIINPTERLSITNDPYQEKLRAVNGTGIGHDISSRNSSCSESDAETETDSIRQLEWDSLGALIDEGLRGEEEGLGGEDARRNKSAPPEFSRDMGLSHEDFSCSTGDSNSDDSGCRCVRHGASPQLPSLAERPYELPLVRRLSDGVLQFPIPPLNEFSFAEPRKMELVEDLMRFEEEQRRESRI